MAFARGDFSDWSLLGEGGEAEIFRARQISLDRMVAIKRLKLASIGNAEEIRRFEGEAKLCASLSHPGLVQVFDYGSEGSFYHIVMEYVAGVDLGKMADAGAGQGRALPDSLKVHLALQMAEAVEFIHRKGVLHRDLKPENFMADLSGRIVLLDLGMARTHAGGHGSADPGILKGSLAYIPPELFRGGRFDVVSEYYSLALVLLEVFSGSRRFRAASAGDAVSRIQSGLDLDGFAGVPAEVKSLLRPYLDPDPSARPGSLESLLRGLKSRQSNTLALAGGRQALEALVRAEQKAWLWALVKASEGAGEVEGAFARLRELLEADPENTEVQARFREMGMRLNDGGKNGAEPAESGARIGKRSGDGSREWRRGRLFAAASIVVIAVTGVYFYLQEGGGFEDLGRDLAEREMRLLSRENDSGPMPAARPLTRPVLRPYGILIATGLPKDHQLLVNRIRHSAAGEIHLPAGRYLIEVEDARRRPVLRDSIAVGGGEPVVFDFTRRAGKP